MKTFFEWSRSIMRAQVAPAIGLAIVLFFAASSASAVWLASAEINDISLSMAKTDSAELSKGKVLGAFNSAQTNFTSQGQQVTRFDTDGNAIDAHDGEIQYFNGTYYLYGTSYTCGFKYLSLNYNQTPFCGFKVYSSTDLRNWKFERLLFDPSTWQGQDSNKNCPNIGCFRPHILARPATAGGGYVLWFNIAAEMSYWVMESSSPAGPFTNPKLAQNVHYTWNGDEALFLDDNGAAYLIHTNYNTGIPEVGDLVIEKLNASFTDSVGEMINTGFEGEAPTLIKRNGTYFLIYSHNCPYCSGTPTRYLFSSSINGPWQDGGIINPNSCGGQPTYVATLNGEYLYMSDLWHSSTPPGTIFANQGLGNYYWGPLTFDSSNKPVLSCQSVPSTDSFVSACDIGGKELMQTFKPANSGQLAAVDFVTFQSGPQSRPDSKDGSLDGSVLPNADLSVQVVKLNGNQPALPALASFSVSSRKTTDGYLTPPGKIDFAPNKISLPLNVAVEAGQEYGLLLKSNIITAGCYGYAYNENNIYSQGRLLKSSNGGSGFSEETGRDIKFNLSFTSAPVTNISNRRPIGYLDGISSDGKIFGWAIDNDNNSQAVKVHLYFDKNAGTAGASPVEATAGDYRGDVGTHAFNFQIPNQLKDGQYHQVWAWAIDLSDNAYNAILLGNPKSFKLAPAILAQPTPTPVPTTFSTINNNSTVVYGPTNLRAYKDIKSVTWYDFPKSIPDSYENLAKVLPQIKAEGYNTVWLGGNAWADYSPKALPTATYNEQAFSGLIKILELLKTNNMEAVIGLNYLGQGWSPEGIDACRWMLDETMYKAFEDYSKEFLSRIQNYSNNVYIVVFTEGSEGSCLGDPYKPELRPGLLSAFQSRLGSWPLRVPPALRSKFRIGYHDYALINENYSGGQSPLSNPNPYDFMSMVAYGLTGKTDTQIVEEVKLKASRFKVLYPYTPLIIGEMGAGFCVPYSEDIQAQNVKALVNAAISNGLGFNLWQWKSLPDNSECLDQYGLGIHKNDGTTLRKSATAVSSILVPGFVQTVLPTPTPYINLPLACVNRTFNQSASGYYSSVVGGTKLSSIQPNQQYFVKCNYGTISSHITLEGGTASSCVYVGWDNLSAVFKCTTPSNGLQLSMACRMNNNPASDNSCNISNSLGNLNVEEQVSVSPRVGQLVSRYGTVYLVAQNGLYGFSNTATFYSWNFNFANILSANSAEIALPEIGIVPVKLPCFSSVSAQIASGVTSCDVVPAPTITPTPSPSAQALSIVTSTLPNAIAGQSYSSVIQLSGGVAPYTWQLVSTTYPSACCILGLNGNLGPIYSSSISFNTQSGTTVTSSYLGSYSWTIKVTDASGSIATKNIYLTVNPAVLTPTPTPVPTIIPTPTPVPTVTIVPTPTPTTLACVQRSFNTANSGIYSGASKISSLTPGQNFTARCDYGIVSGYITLDGNGATNCSWGGWSGTSALFNCIAPLQTGYYNVSCKMTNNQAADNSCSSLNSIGSYYVGLNPTPTPTPIPTVTPTPTPVAVYPRVGQLVNINSTVYLVGQNGRYGFPDLAIFNSWGLNFANVVVANSAEIALPQVGIVPTKLSCYNDIISQITANVTSCPDPVITRDVMAKKLVEKFPLNVSIGLSPSFNDVSQSNQYYSFIEQIYSRGITNGCYYDAASGIRNYCPTEPVKRWQAMLFLSRALGNRVDLTGIPTQQAFRDVPSTNPAFAQTQYFYQREVTIGCRINTDGTRDFCPDDNLTESQFNLLVERIYSAIGY